MQPTPRYIQVILPLKLTWNPWYHLRQADPDVPVGTRVRVNFAGREYVAVVVKVSDTPEIDSLRIKQIVSIENALELISEGELHFWSFLSQYYLCTIGEVYKYVYPSGKTAVEAKRANKKGAGTASVDKPRLSARNKETLCGILDAFVSAKPVFLQAEGRDTAAIFDELSRRTMDVGRDVLILRPGAPRQSYVVQRELAKAVRGPVPVLVEAGRHALFLPFSKLGLIIVVDEHDASYKQSTIAPRYNARDAAIALASQHKANILLVSATPSFETIYNVEKGRYTRFAIQGCKPPCKPVVIGTGAEYNKNGMVGSLSRKLIARLEEVEGRKLLITPWELQDSIKYRKLKIVSPSKVTAENLGSYDLVALINAEALISKNDFRADERALQFIKWLEAETRGELFIQTRDTRHPLFSLDHERYLRQLMEERHSFGYPPFTRMVDVRITDSNPSRLSKMTLQLTELLGGSLKRLLPKDKYLQNSKDELFKSVSDFEAEKKYYSHIYLDVDP